MLHYLFTNDLRHEAWPDILVDTATLIHEDKVPSAAQNKSKNNYICTQASYLCIQKGTKANEYCRKGKVGPVVLNFINRFQFPNARTKESYEQSVGDGMSIAPLRVAVQLLFALRLVDRDQSRLSYDELAKYIVCNQRLVVGSETNLLALATQIVNDREHGITPPHLDSDGLAGKGVEWKHCPRQVKELFSLLEFAPFIRSTAVDVQLEIPESIDAGAAKQFFYIVNNRKLWHAPQATDWSDVQRSYQEYMEAGLAQIEVDVEPPSKIPALPEPNVNRLSVALKLFAEHRLEEDWVALLKWGGYEGIRARYEGMNPETLRSMTAAEFDEWANKELWALQHYRCKQTFDKLTDEQKTACARFVAAVKKNVQPVTSYFPTATNCPEGVGPVVATELLMKFHPLDYMGYSALMLDGMEVLKLLDVNPQYDTAIGYQKTMGIASQILEKMFAMKLFRSFDDEKYVKPDYITVSEFLWWVKTHQDLIKEKVMKQKMKKPNIAKKEGKKTLGALIGQDPDSMMSRLTAALLTKPFAILAGASGTGKSRMVRQLAYMTCLNTDLQEEAKDATAPGNYRLVQVKPNWHDSSDLLGYRSAINEGTYVTTDFVKFVLKAHAYPDTPFFVCLDEMNLAPVEQYFAEFLSASEDVKKADDGKTLVSAALIKPSDFGGDVLNLEPEYELAADRKALIEKIGLFIPHNLYVVGTVNMDDTTCQFSRKVLDRAMTIEMNEVKLETLQQKDVMTFENLLLTELEIKLFAERAEFDGTKLDDVFRGKLETLRGDLESSPFAIAYRFAREAVMYREAIAQIGNDAIKEVKDEIALDHMSLMKILPRITGTTTERKGVMDKLSAFFTGLGRPLSLKKLNEMIVAASGNGEYLSFWP